MKTSEYYPQISQITQISGYRKNHLRNLRNLRINSDPHYSLSIVHYQLYDSP